MKARIKDRAHQERINTSIAYLYEQGREDFIIKATKGVSLNEVKTSDLVIKVTEKVFWLMVYILNTVFKNIDFPSTCFDQLKKIKQISVKKDDGKFDDFILNGPLTCYSLKKDADPALKIRYMEPSQSEGFKRKLNKGYETVESNLFQLNWFSRKEKNAQVFKVKGNGRRTFESDTINTQSEEIMVAALDLTSITLIKESLLIGKCPKDWIKNLEKLNEKEQAKQLGEYTKLPRNILIYLAAFMHCFSRDFENPKSLTNVWDLDKFFENNCILPVESGKLIMCPKITEDFQLNEVCLKTSLKKIRQVVKQLPNSKIPLENDCWKWWKKTKEIEIGLNIFVIDAKNQLIDCISGEHEFSKDYVKIDWFWRNPESGDDLIFIKSFMLNLNNQEYSICGENLDFLPKNSIKDVIEWLTATMVYMNTFGACVGGPWKFPYKVITNTNPNNCK